jgi:hypothetical protein
MSLEHLTPKEQHEKAIRARHQEFDGWCVTCMRGEDAGSVPWPCDAAELLVVIAGLRATVEAMREQAVYGFTGETLLNMTESMTAQEMARWWIETINRILRGESVAK